MIVEGLLVPLVTPFDARGEVDLSALERPAVEVLDAGADGLVALATTGEASSLDEREREAVIAVCADVARARDVLLLVGAGTNGTRTTIARHEALGHADAGVVWCAAVAHRGACAGAFRACPATLSPVRTRNDEKCSLCGQNSSLTFARDSALAPAAPPAAVRRRLAPRRTRSPHCLATRCCKGRRTATKTAPSRSTAPAPARAR